MAHVTHFGLAIVRSTDFTYMTYLDTPGRWLRCRACDERTRGVHRLRGDHRWFCSRCNGLKRRGLEPGPRPFDSQPSRQLLVGERLRGPGGAWTVVESKRTREPGTFNFPCFYVLEREDGHRETWRGAEMVDFHLIPPTEQPTLT